MLVDRCYVLACPPPRICCVDSPRDDCSVFLEHRLVRSRHAHRLIGLSVDQRFFFGKKPGKSTTAPVRISNPAWCLRASAQPPCWIRNSNLRLGTAASSYSTIRRFSNQDPKISRFFRRTKSAAAKDGTALAEPGMLS